MGLTKEKKELVRNYIINNVDKHSNDIVRLTSAHFGLSRQAVNQLIRKIISEGILESKGGKRNINYCFKKHEKEFAFKVIPDMDEDKVWRENIKPNLPEINRNVLDICHYGFTEMLNNVVEHSQSRNVEVVVLYDVIKIQLFVFDNGIGIFNKIQKDFSLDDPKHAILELAKGKLTSDAKRHTGEGIFFTSRMFDQFVIFSGKLKFGSATKPDSFGSLADALQSIQTPSYKKKLDILFEGEENFNGTAVFMEIKRGSETKQQDIFNEYTDEKGDYGFSKTVVPVTLLQYEGEALVSRSQAKRLIARFEKFKEVVLDFSGINTIGQPFADEVFRVFQQQHTKVHLVWINASHDVEKMIKHVKANL